MRVTIFYVVFPTIHHIQIKCGEYLGILHGTLSVPQNISMDLNDVMEQTSFEKSKETKGSVYTGIVGHVH